MLKFVIPIIHVMKQNDKVLIINRDNLRRYLMSLDAYNEVLEAIREDELTSGEYGISKENLAIKTIFNCLAKGIFYFKEKKETQNEIALNNLSNPRIVYLYMTSECNMRCVYCYENANHVSESLTEINIDVNLVLELIDKFVSLGVSEISFTGGEPLLVNDIFEVANYAKNMGIKTTLLTNGTLISESNVKKLKCFDTIKISLDSIKTCENEITRGKGTTKHILNGMKLVKENEMKLIVECVINKSNYDSIEETLSVLYKEIGVDEVRFTYMQPVGRGVNSSLVLEIPYNQSQKQILEAHFRVLGKYNTQNLLGQMSEAPGSTNRLLGCGAGVNEILVECNGSTYPCRMYHQDKYYMGNLLVETLDEIRLNDKFQAFRRGIMVDKIEDCKDCTLKYLCGGGCRPAHQGFTEDYTSNYTQWCSMTKTNLEFFLWCQEKLDPITGQPFLENRT